MTLMLLLWGLLASILLALSSFSMFSLWICLEINMMMFIPIMNSKSVPSSNSMLLYFIIQSLASSLFMISFLLLWLNPLFTSTFNMLISSAILMKLGAAPFHSWFPQVSEGLTYFSFSLLIIFQKMIPLYILTFSNNFMILMSIFFSSIIGSLGGWNQNSLRKIIAFSSIAHLAWMIAIIKIFSHWWLIYFSIYSLIIISLLSILQNKNISYLTQISNFSPQTYTLTFIIIFLSLGGLPPLLGFAAKWLSIKIISSSSPALLFFLVPSSLLNLFFYSRVLYPIIMKMFMKNESPFLKNKVTSLWIPLHCFSLFFLIPLI
uniref:NADH-ubiquinone oxidoreductase chain 2 n=1 Tax=Ogadenus brumpti TaxID=1827023 RepID=A0A1P8AFZ5_9ACAR|nr:NADH dehydrogenase subunit 2 [Ogadenus brumpti]AMX74040.1 NADH dehydrogenase subunit 2 [Ogadenus brumpti]AMX74053.1 NADH dehydrogenase subunit 2 [Ogadenus brumpti]